MRDSRKEGAERPGRRGHISQAFGIIVTETIGPYAGGLLQRQAGAHPVCVRVRHGVIAPRAVFGPQLPARGVSILGRG